MAGARPEQAALTRDNDLTKTAETQRVIEGMVDGLNDHKINGIGDFFHEQVDGRLPADVWYLSILGVDPTRHGAGLGSQLVRAGLGRVDADGRPAFVETFNPRSVPFYERHGFVQTISADEPTTGRRYWLLLRPPRTA